MRNVHRKFVKKIKTHLHSITPPLKIVQFMK